MKKYNNLLEDISEKEYKAILYEKKKNIYALLTIIIILILVILMLIAHMSKHNVSKTENNTDILSEKTLEHYIGEAILYPSYEINDSILECYLTEVGAWYPDILLAQAKIESGTYTSNVFKAANNLYGMKTVNSRFHCQTGRYNSYGHYDSWKLSVIDRILWDLFIFDSIKPDRDQYLRALRNYAEAQNYIETIEKVINSNTKENETKDIDRL